MLTDGRIFSPAVTVPNNPLVKVKVAPEEYTDDTEKEIVTSLRKRSHTAEELEKVQLFLARRKEQLNNQGLELQSEIHKQAYKNSTFQQELLQRERKLAKREKILETKDKDLAERAQILDARDEIMADMPEVMDDKATRDWHAKHRPKILATWLALSVHSTNERTRVQALTRLSDEDRGQHGKDLRDDPDSGPGYFIIEKGTYGIPE